MVVCREIVSLETIAAQHILRAGPSGTKSDYVAVAGFAESD